MHRPIMVREILEVLNPQPGEIAVDCTLGYGGHASALLAAVQPGGRLLGVDADPIELAKTEARLRGQGFGAETLVVKRSNFAGVAKFVAEQAPEGADMLLADLGVSSMQIDDPARGFSFKTDGPLDMRMNPLRGQSAAALLSKLDVEELAELLTENADEPRAAEVAERILKAHERTPLKTTQELAEVVRGTASRRSASRSSGGGTSRGSKRSGDDEETEDRVRRVFQALRIAVNDEFGALDELLRTLPYCMKPGGRVAILTFHSGEDRRVKQAFKAGLQAGTYEKIAEEVIRASGQERRDNPRSSSAKLRYAVMAKSET
ncbi:MAG: 16S rRNA (cytosine(1402)-N(4))-methyltransferase [Planctomycetales bacterium]